MAFLALKSPLSVHCSPICALSRPGNVRNPRRFPISMSATSEGRKSGVAIVWFKHDLRVEDHPGLVAAAQYRDVVPIYVFDHRILSGYSDEMLELLLFALTDLKNSLTALGSDLMIRFGRSENLLPELMKEIRATSIFSEAEVEYSVQMVMNMVKETLELDASAARNVQSILWQTPFYDILNLKELPESHDDFKKLQIPLASPLPIPQFSSEKLNIEWGQVPTYDYLKCIMKEDTANLGESLTSLKDKTAELLLREKLLKSENSIQSSSTLSHSKRKRAGSFFVTKNENVVCGGPATLLNALGGYLRYLEGTARDDWQELHERLRSAESREGASFRTLFGPSLHLGIISRRKVYLEAIKYEKERNGGFLSPFGYSAATVSAAVDAVCSMEWYWLLSRRGQSNKVMHSTRMWRWRSFLVQYSVAGEVGPAVLLVHGFGAFLEHYRDNIYGIANAGNRVWAVTLLGFGRSEKPNTVYTELLWAELLRDFLIEVVGEPVHIVGNSIGGYISAIVAGLWPALVKSAVLLNSAGNVVPGKTVLSFSKERQTSGIARLGARLLLYYLRASLRGIVRNCYPTKPERADEWLTDEMLRASHDPGVLVVLESIFSFDLSIPLNFLLEGLNEKVLVIQGMKDPISNSESMVAMLKEECPRISIREIDAGHCPQDERPEDVNSIISDWIIKTEKKLLNVKAVV